MESRHSRTLRPLRADLLPAALARYPTATRLDLTLCVRVLDTALASTAVSALHAINLSFSYGFGAVGVSELAIAYPGLVDLNLSNVVDPQGRHRGRGGAGQGTPEALAGPLEAAH